MLIRPTAYHIATNKTLRYGSELWEDKKGNLIWSRTGVSGTRWPAENGKVLVVFGKIVNPGPIDQPVPKYLDVTGYEFKTKTVGVYDAEGLLVMKKVLMTNRLLLVVE